jgi:hypothetical protein
MRRFTWVILLLMFLSSVFFSFGCAPKKDEPIDLTKGPAPTGEKTTDK